VYYKSIYLFTDISLETDLNNIIKLYLEHFVNFLILSLKCVFIKLLVKIV